MASGKMGALMTDLKGSAGGTSFQGSRSGLTVKNKGRHVVQQSGGLDAPALERRNQFSAITKLWGTLTDAQRIGWKNLLGIWTFVNKFGDVYNGTGYQIFCAANLNRIELAESTIGSDPAVINAFDPGLSFSDFSVGGASFDYTTTNASATGQKAVLYLSNNVNPSVGYPRTKILAKAVATLPVPQTVSWYALVVAAFGFVPPVGSIFYVKMWTCWPAYPKKSFETIYKINVVA